MISLEPGVRKSKANQRIIFQNRFNEAGGDVRSLPASIEQRAEIDDLDSYELSRRCHSLKDVMRFR